MVSMYLEMHLLPMGPALDAITQTLLYSIYGKGVFLYVKELPLTGSPSVIVLK